MLLRCITFLLGLIFLGGALFYNAFAEELLFSSPTYGDISSYYPATGISDTYPLFTNIKNAQEYCTIQGLYYISYTSVSSLSSQRKANYNANNSVWNQTSNKSTEIGEIICSDLPPIGVGRVIGTSLFTQNIYWDTLFPGSGSGSVKGLLIKAKVNPTLNMEISVSEIDLGTLVAGTASTGSLAIEIGTNAVNGVSITARSQSGGLTNTSDNAIQINTNTSVADPVASESYTWASTIGTSDSSFGTFAAENATGNGLDSAVEITENTTEYNVYTSNKPEATSGVDDVVFNVSATAQAETPAGDYEDKLLLL